MPVYKVPVTAFVEAATREEAQSRAFDSKAELPGKYLFGQAGQPEELSPERTVAIREFATMLNTAGSPPDAGTVRRLRNDATDDHD